MKHSMPTSRGRLQIPLGYLAVLSMGSVISIMDMCEEMENRGSGRTLSSLPGNATL